MRMIEGCLRLILAAAASLFCSLRRFRLQVCQFLLQLGDHLRLVDEDVQKFFECGHWLHAEELVNGAIDANTHPVCGRGISLPGHHGFSAFCVD